MVSDALKPKVQDLQQDVIELLKNISFLMGRASTALGSDSAGNKYGEFQQEISDAASNVKDLALRMAIVAPMKAGKSTIINAVIGQDILPSRNAAMTTLPTEIVFNTDLSEPILILSPQILAVFQETLLALKRQIDALEDRGRSKIAQYPQLAPLLEKIQAMGVVSIPAKTEGQSEINKALTDLNDIIRLCSAIEPLADPLQSLLEIPRIHTPFWRSQTTKPSNQLGNLVIIDTPGPNEAGENLRLANVVDEQLQKSSLVLVVLDFTQLRTEAAEKIKTDVQQVIKLRGLENLYVLINKVDQRRDGDMTSEQVRDFVTADLGLEHQNRVFEVAARWAFTATNFMLELQQYPGISISESQTARALAQEVFGIDWEEELEDAEIEELQKKAQRLWKKSGFAPFLDQAINALMERAAPRCMKSALNIADGHLVQLYEDVQLRSSAIAKDEEKLRLEVGALQTDLQRLELCRTRLRAVEQIKAQLHQRLDEILETLKKESQISLETFFDEKEYERAGIFKKVAMGLGQIVSYLHDRKSNGSSIIEFDSLEEAEDFSTLAFTYPKQRAEHLMTTFREKLESKIEHSRQEIVTELSKETQPIIEQARKRLNETFSLDFSLPSPTLKSVDMDLVKPQIESNSRWIDQGYATTVVQRRAWHHWLWIVPFEENVYVKRPNVKEDYYTVSLEEIVEKVNQLIEENIKNIKQGMNQYLEAEFQHEIDSFFKGLDCYLTNYRDSLCQAQLDQKLSLEQKVKLVEELKSIESETKKKIEELDKYLKRTDSLIER